jgi:hypothetical protein
MVEVDELRALIIGFFSFWKGGRLMFGRSDSNYWGRRNNFGSGQWLSFWIRSERRCVVCVMYFFLLLLIFPPSLVLILGEWEVGVGSVSPLCFKIVGVFMKRKGQGSGVLTIWKINWRQDFGGWFNLGYICWIIHYSQSTWAGILQNYLVFWIEKLS